MPEMDRIAREGVLGRSRNVPDRFLPASDVATLSLFGYDPEEYYTGRAPLEAAAMGIPLGPDDWAVRCNLMTILDGKHDRLHRRPHHERGGRRLSLIRGAAPAASRSAEHRDLRLSSSSPGVSYRNLHDRIRGRAPARPAVLADATTVTDPAARRARPAGRRPPAQGHGSDLLRELMREAAAVLARPSGEPGPASRPASDRRTRSGSGARARRPSCRPSPSCTACKGAIISAVDLVRGVGVLAGWDRIDVPGATGYLDTDYAAKGRYGVDGPDRPRHRLRPRRGARRGEPRGPGRRQGRGPRADRPRHRRPAARGAEVARPLPHYRGARP